VTVGEGRAPLLATMVARRLSPAADGSAPDEAELATILGAATTVPDHGHLRPWRFVVVSGRARQGFSDALVAGLHLEKGEDLPGPVVEKMAGKAFAAPLQVMVVSSPVQPSNVPLWEQTASASCTGYAIVLAASALGFGAVWKSAPVVQSDPVRTLFGATADEQLLGWVNLGTPDQRPVRSARSRVDDLEGLVTVLPGGSWQPSRSSGPHYPQRAIGGP